MLEKELGEVRSHLGLLAEKSTYSALEKELGEVRSHLGLLAEKSTYWENDAQEVRELRNDLSELRITITDILRTVDVQLDTLARRTENLP
jgi:5-bromo-4-chloroindolyl phosphate hydrolysis protein